MDSSVGDIFDEVWTIAVMVGSLAIEVEVFVEEVLVIGVVVVVVVVVVAGEEEWEDSDPGTLTEP